MYQEFSPKKKLIYFRNLRFKYNYLKPIVNTKLSLVESEEYATCIYMYRKMATFDMDWELKLTDAEETARHTSCPSHVTPHSIQSLRGLNRYSSTVKNFMYIINLIKIRSFDMLPS